MSHFTEQNGDRIARVETIDHRRRKVNKYRVHLEKRREHRGRMMWCGATDEYIRGKIFIGEEGFQEGVRIAENFLSGSDVAAHH